MSAAGNYAIGGASAEYAPTHAHGEDPMSAGEALAADPASGEITEKEKESREQDRLLPIANIRYAAWRASMHCRGEREANPRARPRHDVHSTEEAV
jgi:hypothetical protein